MNHILNGTSGLSGTEGSLFRNSCNEYPENADFGEYNAGEK
jgi:hypothetical protein